MPSLIVILSLTFSSFFVAFDSTQMNKESVYIEFSSPAIGYESGQPVYSKETAATLNTLKFENVRILINENVDVELSTDRVNLSELITFSEGTYTVVVKGDDYEEVFGFTIK